MQRDERLWLGDANQEAVWKAWWKSQCEVTSFRMTWSPGLKYGKRTPGTGEK